MLKEQPRDDDGTGTEPLSSGSEKPPPPGQQGVSIILYYRDGMTPVRLEPGQSVVVGRSEPADVRIPDRALSREHARFSLRSGRVLVEDVGSSNGTWIADKRIERETEIEFGGEVMLGTVIARVLAFGAAWDHSVESDELFRRKLDDEATRAQHFHRPFTILAVRASGQESTGGPVGAWAAGLKAKLRATDRVGLYTPDTALILLPETGSEVALERARAIASTSGGGSAPHLVGVAVYPESASTVEELIQLAREAAGRATVTCPVATASTAAWTESSVAGCEEQLIAGEAMRAVLDEARRVASSHAAVLLFGETGTGKEVLASFIHEHSPRHDKRMLHVNCGAFSTSLLHSTLFGHEKGAFTGAIHQQRGLFEEADQSTLFLDEIGELSTEAQAALLRVLGTRDITRVGSTRELIVNVRVIAATNRDLEAMVRAGNFREDLLYRLNTVMLEIPPLRDRSDEIEPLVRRFMDEANKTNNRRVRGISKEAMALLRAHDWPGNVRELRNAIERAVVMARSDLIQPDDLPARVRSARISEAPAAEATASRAALKAEVTPPVDPLEAQKVEKALQETRWKQEAAAKLLGVSARTLRRKMDKLGLKTPKA